jgi:hypothetical protein
MKRSTENWIVVWNSPQNVAFEKSANSYTTEATGPVTHSGEILTTGNSRVFDKRRLYDQ